MRALLLASILTLTVFAGCLADDADDDDAPAITTIERGAVTTLEARGDLPFNTTGDWSHTLLAGNYDILPGQSFDIPVTIPVTEGSANAATGLTVNLGLFLPDVPAGTPVPVVADVGPYYSASSGIAPQTEGDTVATDPANRLGRFLIENLVPHGYAVAQVSVVGTGDSGGCQDLMGTTEQAGVHAAVEWLGSQEWSNGNVGLIGRSYDGSTPWQAAAWGSEHLKTIVPISGLTGVHELMWRNGTAETRGGTGLLYAIYAAMTIDGDAGDIEAACQDYAAGAFQSGAAYVTGDHVAPAANDYWTERYFFDRALENYDGSVYYIHGLQDWNVDPHMAFPYYQRLIDAGFEVKGLFGQWDHAYPDRDADHSDLTPGYGGEAYPLTIRYDWAQDLLEWFDHYLAGTGDAPALHAEVQDNQGDWRIEETWPPVDVAWHDAVFGDDLVWDRGDLLIGPNNGMGADDGPRFEEGAVFSSEPLSADVRIAGQPVLHVTATPTGASGQLFVDLWDATLDIHLGHATLDLRFNDGPEATPTVAGQEMTARLEFEPMDVLVRHGTVLELRFAQTGMDYLPGPASEPVAIGEGSGLPITGGPGMLRLPVVPAWDRDFFVPPQSDAQAMVRCERAATGYEADC